VRAARRDRLPQAVVCAQALTRPPPAGWRTAAGLLLAALLWLAGGAAVVGGEPTSEAMLTGAVQPNQVCMLNNFVIKLQDGDPYVYEGQTYYFCCAGCIRRFAAHPEKFRVAVDPVNAREVDKATALLYALQDVVYYFSSGKTLEEFAKDPQRYLNKDKAAASSAAPPTDGRRVERSVRR